MDTLDAEIAVAQERLEKLQRLVKLKQQADDVEFELFYVSETRIETIILSVVCKRFGVSLELLRSRRRTARLSWPRFVVMYFLCRHTKLPQEKIVRAVNRKDHAMAIYGPRQVEHRLGLVKDGEFRKLMGELEAEIEIMLRQEESEQCSALRPEMVSVMHSDRNGS